MTFWGTERVWFVLVLSVMLLFLLSDALLITLSWCIRGEDTAGRLTHVIESQLQPTRFNTSPYIYLCISVYSCLRNRGLLEAADPQELPSCRAQQVGVLKITLSSVHSGVILCQSNKRLSLLPDSNNSGDNLYTMINTGPGNRNNVNARQFNSSVDQLMIYWSELGMQMIDYSLIVSWPTLSIE